MLFILCLVLSVPAFADSAKIDLGSFKGKLQIKREQLDVVSIEVEVSNQFCNFWGTTCAGGPQDSQVLAIQTTDNNDGSITISHEGEFELSSLKIGNKFSSCNVTLYVVAINNAGRSMSGSQTLAWINDKEICGSQKAITNVVRQRLAKTLVVEDAGYYLRVQ